MLRPVGRRGAQRGAHAVEDVGGQDGVGHRGAGGTIAPAGAVAAACAAACAIAGAPVAGSRQDGQAW